MDQYYKVVQGVDEQGKPTTFKVEIPQSEINKIRAWNLVTEKFVDLSLLKRCRNVISYNTQSYGQRLDMSEFDFLKGVTNSGTN